MNVEKAKKLTENAISYDRQGNLCDLCKAHNEIDRLEKENKELRKKYAICQKCGCLSIAMYGAENLCHKCNSKGNLKEVCIEIEWAKQAERIKELEANRYIAYKAYNRTSVVYFECKEDAKKYAYSGTTASGINVSEIKILPKQALKVTK